MYARKLRISWVSLACCYGIFVTAPLSAQIAATMFRRIHQGKHRGATFADVAATDKGYASWVLRTDFQSLPTSLQMFQEYLTSTHGGILTVGKHKSKYFSDVLENDPACRVN